MFKEKVPLELHHLNLIDDSDNESLSNNALPSNRVKSARTALEENQIWQFLKSYMVHFLSPEVVTKLNLFGEKIYDISRNDCLRKFLTHFYKIFLWLYHVLMIISSKIGCVSLWKVRFRNVTRRLLWCMTLAKCEELSLFAFVLFCTPWLFIVAALGFILSLYSTVKLGLQKLVVFIKMHIF